MEWEVSLNHRRSLISHLPISSNSLSSHLSSQAGKASVASNESTSNCLKFGERPPTPELDRKYRTVQEPGVRIRHPGLRNDKVDDSAVFGDFATGSEHVPDVLGHGATKPLDSFMQSRGEAIYRSVKREPLGKPFS